MRGYTVHFAGIFAAGLLVAPMSAMADALAKWPETVAMVAAPDDEAAVYRFVDRARREGRLDEAANAVERYLRFYPDDTRAITTLADLYTELGFGARAETFRERLPQEGEEDASLDVEISGFFAVGGGYDTNPSAAPFDRVVNLVVGGAVDGVPLNITPDDTFFGTAAFGVDIRTAESAETPAFLIELEGSGTIYEDAEDQDDYAFGLSIGPEYAAADGTLRPFIGGSASWFDHQPYSVSGEVGARFEISDATSFTKFEGAVGWSEYFDTISAPSRSDLDGVEARLGVSHIALLDENLFGSLGARLIGRAADEDFESYLGLTLSAAVVQQIPANDLIPDLTLTAGGGGTGLLYGGADPDLNPDRDRRDLALFAFGSASAEIAENTNFELTLSYRHRFSTYDIYRSDGIRAAFRFVRRF